MQRQGCKQEDGISRVLQRSAYSKRRGCQVGEDQQHRLYKGLSEDSKGWGENQELPDFCLVGGAMHCYKKKQRNNQNQGGRDWESSVFHLGQDEFGVLVIY